ncbi:hypothetical protein BofuT4_uP124410.1 [Botrytis cinerea T4]|uniref:Uncharacterized protein n=1 Tax=Botryotinia fuckeliana (strain T4) TaxID=999810 RepID=G2YRZ5_BOTF4|nr:hypothetical protein BofuT4_uP124410.1 [Botrytis cinerea T4]
MGCCRRDAASFRITNVPTMRMRLVAGIYANVGFICPQITQTPITKFQTFPDCSNVGSDTKYNTLDLEQRG